MAAKTLPVRTGEFLLSESNGTRSRDEVTFASGAGVVLPGTLVGQITASKKFAPYLNTATDGSEVAKGIAYARVDATAADAPGVIIDRDAEAAGIFLTGLDDAGKADLAALGVIVR